MNITDEQREAALSWLEMIQIYREHYQWSMDGGLKYYDEEHLYILRSALEPQTVTEDQVSRWASEMKMTFYPAAGLQIILNELGITIKEKK